MVIDAGAENNMHYASDFTRTYPTDGKYTAKQREIYQIVCDCNELAYKLTKPGITYREVHLKTMHLMILNPELLMFRTHISLNHQQASHAISVFVCRIWGK